MMMRLWRRLGVDKLLRQAYENGIVLSGISAGCELLGLIPDVPIPCSFYNPRKWKYINVKGLGLINGIPSPLQRNDARHPSRKHPDIIRKTGGMGIAMRTSCAIEFIDGKLPVIRSKGHARGRSDCTKMAAKW